MDISEFDAQETLDYLLLLSLVVRAFPVAACHDELVEALGASRLTDVSDLPIFRQMDAADPLPPGYTQRVYQFRDSSLGRGIVDAAFHGRLLVNVRAQLFVQGWFANFRARRYLAKTLIPSTELFFGPAVERSAHHSVFRNRGLVVVTRYLPGSSSVSTYLMHEDYA